MEGAATAPGIAGDARLFLRQEKLVLLLSSVTGQRGPVVSGGERAANEDGDSPSY